MKPWLVIPVKSLRDGKTRLAPSLDPDQRYALMSQLLDHTLRQASEFPGLDTTIIVSNCAETRERATGLGASMLEEPGQGLNAALDRARECVRNKGTTRMIVVPSDLPFLHSDDILQLSQLPTSGHIAIAPDLAGQGTNGLCVEASLEFRFAFGPASFACHVENARRLGLEYIRTERPGLAFDVDTPEDLSRLINRGGFRPDPNNTHA